MGVVNYAQCSAFGSGYWARQWGCSTSNATLYLYSDPNCVIYRVPVSFPVGCVNTSSYGLYGQWANFSCVSSNLTASPTSSQSPAPGNATASATATATPTASATPSASAPPPPGLTGSIAFYAAGDVTCAGKAISLAPVGPVCSPVVVGQAVVYYVLLECAKGKGVLAVFRDGACSGAGRNVTFSKGCTPAVTTSYTFKCSSGGGSGGNGTEGSDVAAAGGVADELGALLLAASGTAPSSSTAAAAGGEGPAAPSGRGWWLAAAPAPAAAAACLAAGLAVGVAAAVAVAARRRLAASSQPPVSVADAAVALLSQASS